MKKIIYSIVASAMLFSFASCADMMDLKSPDQLTQDNYFRDQNDAMATLASAYCYIGNPEMYYGEHKWVPEEYRTDLLTPGTDAFQYGDWISISNFTAANSNSVVNGIWSKAYRGIHCTNRTLEGTPRVPEGKIDESERNAIIAEARFLRAYYHFYLQMNFKNIILRDKAVAGVSDVAKPLSKRADSWNFIIEEFRKAAEGGMKTSHPASELGRATRNTAYAYMGYAMVNRAYETASEGFGQPDQTMLKAAITEAFDKIEGASLESNFRSLFDGSNQFSSESIFERAFTQVTDGGFQLMTVQHQWILAKSLDGFDEMVPTKKLIDIFEKEKNDQGGLDKRGIATLIWDTEYFNTPGNFPYEYEVTVDGVVTKKWATFKEVFEKDKRNPKGSFYKFVSSNRADIYTEKTPTSLKEDVPSVNISLMRYANVLLLKAECLAQTGDAAGAFAIVNEIRATHGGMPATKETDAMAAIEHERVMEFTIEDSRFYDLRRWGKLQTAFVGTDRTFAPGAEFYPLPNVESDNNPSAR